MADGAAVAVVQGAGVGDHGRRGLGAHPVLIRDLLHHLGAGAEEAGTTTAAVLDVGGMQPVAEAESEFPKSFTI